MIQLIMKSQISQQFNSIIVEQFRIILISIAGYRYRADVMLLAVFSLLRGRRVLLYNISIDIGQEKVLCHLYTNLTQGAIYSTVEFK